MQGNGSENDAKKFAIMADPTVIAVRAALDKMGIPVILVYEGPIQSSFVKRQIGVINR